MKQFMTCQTVALLSLISLPLGVVAGSDLPTGWLHVWYCSNYLLPTTCPSDIHREPKLSLLGVGHLYHPVTRTLAAVGMRPYRSSVYGNLWIQGAFRLYFNARTRKNEISKSCMSVKVSFLVYRMCLKAACLSLYGIMTRLIPLREHHSFFLTS